MKYVYCIATVIGMIGSFGCCADFVSKHTDLTSQVKLDADVQAQRGDTSISGKASADVQSPLSLTRADFPLLKNVYLMNPSRDMDSRSFSTFKLTDKAFSATTFDHGMRKLADEVREAVDVKVSKVSEPIHEYEPVKADVMAVADIRKLADDYEALDVKEAEPVHESEPVKQEADDRKLADDDKSIDTKEAQPVQEVDTIKEIHLGDTRGHDLKASSSIAGHVQDQSVDTRAQVKAKLNIQVPQDVSDMKTIRLVNLPRDMRSFSTVKLTDKSFGATTLDQDYHELLEQPTQQFYTDNLPKEMSFVYYNPLSPSTLGLRDAGSRRQFIVENPRYETEYVDPSTESLIVIGSDDSMLLHRSIVPVRSNMLIQNQPRLIRF